MESMPFSIFPTSFVKRGSPPSFTIETPTPKSQNFDATLYAAAVDLKITGVTNQWSSVAMFTITVQCTYVPYFVELSIEN